MDNLIHVIYASQASNTLDNAGLISLLKSSRTNNLRNNISGMLLHNQGSFFQILEGKEDKVEATLKVISTDNRHLNVTIIIQEPIFKRAFGEWSMGFADVSSQKLTSIDGTNDFYAQGTCFTNLDEGRSKKLLKAFSQGYWHQMLN